MMVSMIVNDGSTVYNFPYFASPLKTCVFFHQLLPGMLEQPGSEKILEADLILLALGFLGDAWKRLAGGKSRSSCAFLMVHIHVWGFHKWGIPKMDG